MIAAAISRLRDAGFTVGTDGDRLAITGPLMTEPQRAFIAKNKLAIIAALTAEVSQDPVVAAALAEWPGATIIAIRQLKQDHQALLGPANPDAWK
jgi:hypothetical protein